MGEFEVSLTFRIKGDDMRDAAAAMFRMISVNPPYRFWVRNEGGVAEEGGEGGMPGGEGAGGGEADAMYDQAVAVVLKHRRASISLVQRHLRIGYNRAARLLEQMEQSGLVSSMQSNGNREILVPASNNPE